MEGLIPCQRALAAIARTPRVRTRVWLKRRAGCWSLLVFASLDFSGAAYAEESALPVADRAVIEAVAGAGFLVTELTAPHLDDPERFLGFSVAQRNFSVRDTDSTERSERHSWQQNGAAGAAWHYLAGEAEIDFVDRRGDGSYVISGIRDKTDNALTRYEPAEPLLLQGMLPGEEYRQQMQVSVYDATEGGGIDYRGTLQVAHRFIGAFRILTPDGLHDAILTKSVLEGSVGPAQLHDVQYRFFSEGLGIVATIELREVRAAVVYHSSLRVARLLSGVGPQPTVCSRRSAAAREASAASC